MALKIYTKTGDKGQTALFGGKRVSKADPRVDAYGTVDELNSAIGVVLAHNNHKELKAVLTHIQNDLLDIGSTLATPAGTNHKSSSTDLDKRTKEFEELIDTMTKQLPELQNFILPGGGVIGTQLHLVRTVARRCERKIVALSEKEEVDKAILIYFNRLSDLFFTMGRFVNHLEKQEEQLWKK